MHTQAVSIRPTYLVEIWIRLRLADAIEVTDINELEVVEEAGVGVAVLLPDVDVRQVAEFLVAPVVQVTQTTAQTRVSCTGHRLQHRHGSIVQVT